MRARHEAEVIKIELLLEESILFEQILQAMRCRSPEAGRKISQMYFDLRMENRASKNYNAFHQPGGSFLFAGEWLLTGPMSIEELNPPAPEPVEEEEEIDLEGDEHA